MLDLILLIVFVIGMIVGARRGLIVQLLHMIGFIVALVVAYRYYKPLAEYFVLWIPYPAVTDNATLTIAIEQLNLDQTFYHLLAFALIFFAVKFALQLIAAMFDFVKYFPLLGIVSSILGAVLGFVEVYILSFIILYVLALLPIESIQTFLDNSVIVGLMLEHTPYFSEKVKEWWYIYN
ncbi:CvpA family protein [Planomicrobium sp. YIM 101495]|uniref:CvpA family protein n=1 Tax=Planomicrobium sp. YIM 101495 TaxID=2665160 RepID=UPI0012B9E4E3|nr:CvpA family protein [Planomicrobium sp. YIM 101495]MTD29620.1 hypothetical protein [Planomicrobium sp. YIM 101495]